LAKEITKSAIDCPRHGVIRVQRARHQRNRGRIALYVYVFHGAGIPPKAVVTAHFCFPTEDSNYVQFLFDRHV
jgi:hypothetical protein